MKLLFKKLFTSLSVLTLLSITSSANAGLIISKDHNLIYDDVSNITWLANISYVKTSGYDKDGKLTFSEAKIWSEELEVFGHDDWRLASLDEGLSLQQSKNDFDLFSNRLLDDDHIWTSTTKATNSGLKSHFFTLGGDSNIFLPKTSSRYAWAVFDGKFTEQSNDKVDATIAEPATVTIFSLALAGMVVRRKQLKTSKLNKPK
jgi:hypothetical protein